MSQGPSMVSYSLHFLSLLPPEIRLEWARKGEGKEGDLGWLVNDHKYLKRLTNLLLRRDLHV